MSQSTWWYGIVPFPVVVLTALTARFASRAFFAAARPSTDATLGADVAWFALQTLSFWTGVLVAVIVLVCLLADCRTLSGDEAWSPSIWWGLAGVVHLGGPSSQNYWSSRFPRSPTICTDAMFASDAPDKTHIGERVSPVPSSRVG
ncbi:hypothetical protein [Natrinema sp. SYSU A 869]|uniref:hypothetical protein n=1 Tax=Natrinema sp. SYSU A 869 TaxID=2871694 RepID=UPI0021083DEC|nr:hypothetical protein [Natrinema sp. SYSU A 869]